MTLDDLKADLSERLGRRVLEVFDRDGEPVTEITALYQPSPAGFGGQLRLRDGRSLAWELWLEDQDNWNFHARELPT